MSTVGRPMEILLIEDNLMAAKLAAQAVRSQEFMHHLTWMNDGQDAMTFLLREDRYARAPLPDLVLLDLNLPGMQGIDILRRMRVEPGLAKVPVVVMTADSVTAPESSFGDLQVEGFLTKPFKANEFQELLIALRGHWRTGML